MLLVLLRMITVNARNTADIQALGHSDGNCPRVDPMRLHLITVGEPKLKYARLGWEEYEQRLRRYHRL